MRSRNLLVGALALSAAFCVAMPSVPPAVAAVGGACTGASRPASYDHVVWIIFENKSLSDLTSGSQAPVLQSLMRSCAYSTNHHDLVDHSLPNYLVLTSGSTHGVKRDGPPKDYAISGASIFSQLGSGWRTYVDGMATPCQRTDGSDYAVRHNPAAYYTSLTSTCTSNDRPMGSTLDLSARFTLLLPDLNHSMHDTKLTRSTAQQLAAGDAWAAKVVPQVLASPEYRSGRTALFVVWDEGAGSVPLIAAAPAIRPGTTTSVPNDHRALLRMTEEMLGLPPLSADLPPSAALRAGLGL